MANIQYRWTNNGSSQRPNLYKQRTPKTQEREDADDSNIYHGTMVASKALGQKYGVAKKATLVSVKVSQR
jgi:hypothetical protein